MTTFDWHSNGFAEQPKLEVATGGERLYRAWGGDPQRKLGNEDLAGVCFSLDRASSRWHAEMLYAVMEYRNPVRFITKFSVARATPIWKGRVDPGDSRGLLGEVSGTQIFIERRFLHLVCELGTSALQNDLGPNEVFQGRLPRVHS